MHPRLAIRKSNSLTATLAVAVLGLAWLATAQAEIILLEDAIEAETARVSWHGLRAGHLRLKQCAKCPQRRLRADNSTRYKINGVGQYSDPREFLAQLRSPAVRAGTATIFLHRDSNQVRRIVLSPAQEN